MSILTVQCFLFLFKDIDLMLDFFQFLTLGHKSSFPFLLLLFFSFFPLPFLQLLLFLLLTFCYSSFPHFSYFPQSFNINDWLMIRGAALSLILTPLVILSKLIILNVIYLQNTSKFKFLAQTFLLSSKNAYNWLLKVLFWS